MVRRLRKIGRFTFAAFVLHTLASWQTINGAHRISPVNAALAPAIGPWYHTANWVFYSIQGWIVVFGLWAYYRWLALVCTLFGASAALYRGLVIRSPSVQGLQLRELAAQHSLLQQGVRWSRRGLEGAVVVVVLCCAALPLAATVHLALTYHHDPRPLGKVVALLFRLIANALVLLCFAGDELERESQSLMQSLYDAPWLEESPSDRLTRRNFMQGAEKGVTVAVRSLGHLNRPFCLYVIEKWFSVLQVLIKIQGGGGNS